MNDKIIQKLRKIRTPYIWANPQNCIACWKCIKACSANVIAKKVFLWHKHIYIKNASRCIGCKKCIKVCPESVFSENIPDLLKSLLLKKGVDISRINADIGAMS
ncbi:MAG: 4Fe-4S binding protein [Campylobacteraceae bacterium]|jgi:2-oxoglutarate ferredoxin oxidoreductase subunit delta|nr:4Fe-4S binding protein [Campylobacteraceae bacterium]